MKKAAAMIIILLLGTMLLGTTAALAKETTAVDENDFDNFQTVITPGILGEDMVFDVMPEGYNYYPTEHKGTIERLYYTTDAYDDGETYTKYVTVYLPYGYDPEDKDTRYNVLYFQHGNASSPNALWDAGVPKFNSLNMIDNMFDPDHQLMDPMIIISPTYYFDCDETMLHTDPADGPAGDSRYEGIAGNFYREIVEDLIPQIESRYNVYCEDFSEEGIKASRDHRAFSGYSRGSCCTWYVMHHDMEYFGYFMPMSANILPEGKGIGGDSEEDIFTPEDAYGYIKEALDANPDLDVFVFATAGGEKDGAGQNMIPQMQCFYDHPETFSYGLDPEENNFYFALSEFRHMDLVMPYTLYNARNILFK